jgi:hypothetical protein
LIGSDIDSGPDNFSSPDPQLQSRQANILRLTALSGTKVFVMIRKRHWSFKDDRRLMELGRASKSLQEVVEETGRPPAFIKKKAMRLGLSFKSQAKKK